MHACSRRAGGFAIHREWGLLVLVLDETLKKPSDEHKLKIKEGTSERGKDGKRGKSND